MRRLGVVSVLGVLFCWIWSGVAATSPAAEASPSAFTVSSTRIGSVRITPSTSYAGVIRYVRGLRGGHPKATFRSGECRISSTKYGLKFVLVTFSVTGRNDPSVCRVSLIELTSTSWHTTNGLHPGDTLTKLRRLFPHATLIGRTTGGEHWARPVNAVEWWLAPVRSAAMHPNLGAYVTNGRVVALVISIVGH